MRERPRTPHGHRPGPGTSYVGWWAPCNDQGLARGIAVGTGWHQLTLPVDGTLPNRYVAGFDVDPG